ncbi:hypothetical protein ATCC90586_009670 [Pythium insidiosum]|nr:hypothetical protein ATCC90586_009670 [Pythium insidiosum]
MATSVTPPSTDDGRPASHTNANTNADPNDVHSAADGPADDENSFGDLLAELLRTLPAAASSVFLRSLSGLSPSESHDFCEHVARLKPEKQYRVIHAMADASVDGKRRFLAALARKMEEQAAKQQQLEAQEQKDLEAHVKRKEALHAKERVRKLNPGANKFHSFNAAVGAGVAVSSTASSSGSSQSTGSSSSSSSKENVANGGNVAVVPVSLVDAAPPSSSSSSSGVSSPAPATATATATAIARKADGASPSTLVVGRSLSSSSLSHISKEDIKVVGALLGNAHITESEMNLRELEISSSKLKPSGDASPAADMPDASKRERPESSRELLKLEQKPMQRTRSEDTDSASADADGDADAGEPAEDPEAPSTKRWTKLQDNALRESVRIHGEKNWKAIAELVPGRNHAQCLQRWRKVLKPGLVKGHWSFEEDQILEYLVTQGCNNWGQIAERIPGRTPKQCRERWKNHLDPAINKGPYTEEEDKVILDAQARLGNKWSQIAQLLKGRTEDSVKIRWKSLKQNPAKAAASHAQQKKAQQQAQHAQQQHQQLQSHHQVAMAYQSNPALLRQRQLQLLQQQQQMQHSEVSQLEHQQLMQQQQLQLRLQERMLQQQQQQQQQALGQALKLEPIASTGLSDSVMASPSAPLSHGAMASQLYSPHHPSPYAATSPFDHHHHHPQQQQQHPSSEPTTPGVLPSTFHHHPYDFTAGAFTNFAGGDVSHRSATSSHRDSGDAWDLHADLGSDQFTRLGENPPPATFWDSYPKHIGVMPEPIPLGTQPLSSSSHAPLQVPEDDVYDESMLEKIASELGSQSLHFAPLKPVLTPKDSGAIAAKPSHREISTGSERESMQAPEDDDHDGELTGKRRQELLRRANLYGVASKTRLPAVQRASDQDDARVRKELVFALPSAAGPTHGDYDLELEQRKHREHLGCRPAMDQSQPLRDLYTTVPKQLAEPADKRAPEWRLGYRNNPQSDWHGAGMRGVFEPSDGIREALALGSASIAACRASSTALLYPSPERSDAEVRASMAPFDDAEARKSMARRLGVGDHAAAAAQRPPRRPWCPAAAATVAEYRTAPRAKPPKAARVPQRFAVRAVSAPSLKSPVVMDERCVEREQAKAKRVLAAQRAQRDQADRQKDPVKRYELPVENPSCPRAYRLGLEPVPSSSSPSKPPPSEGDDRPRLLFRPKSAFSLRMDTTLDQAAVPRSASASALRPGVAPPQGRLGHTAGAKRRPHSASVAYLRHSTVYCVEPASASASAVATAQPSGAAFVSVLEQERRRRREHQVPAMLSLATRGVLYKIPVPQVYARLRREAVKNLTRRVLCARYEKMPLEEYMSLCGVGLLAASDESPEEPDDDDDKDDGTLYDRLTPDEQDRLELFRLQFEDPARGHALAAGARAGKSASVDVDGSPPRRPALRPDPSLALAAQSTSLQAMRRTLVVTRQQFHLALEAFALQERDVNQLYSALDVDVEDAVPLWVIICAVEQLHTSHRELRRARGLLATAAST